jgi:hypothetical protein
MSESVPVAATESEPSRPLGLGGPVPLPIAPTGPVVTFPSRPHHPY